MKRLGFTVVEILITITIMGILLTLAVVNLSGSQVNARDDERKADVEALQVNLETFYRSGAQVDNAPSTITNLVPNPKVAINTTGWQNPSTGGGSGTVSREVSGGPANIPTFYRKTVTATMTTSPISFSPTGNGTSGVPVQGSQTYTVSAYVRTSFLVSTGFRFDIIQYNSGGTQVKTTSSTEIVPVTNTWVRIKYTITTEASTQYLQASSALVGNIGAGPGETFDSTGFMVTEGSVAYDYNDGDSTGWTWNGTANSSSSSGPSVVSGIAGSYPGIVMLSSYDMLKSYLGDVDTKSFTPPGVSDPTLGFIAATNADQTTSGVTPQPTTSQYVYQPIDSSGGLCADTFSCRKYNIFYRLEGDNTVYKVTSKNQ